MQSEEKRSEVEDNDEEMRLLYYYDLSNYVIICS